MSQFGQLLRVGLQRARQDASSRWSVEQLHRHQQRGLAELRRFVRERSPFYRRFHYGLDDAALAELPILDKATLMAEFDRLVTDPAIRLADVEAHLAAPDPGLPYLGRYTALSTSGSTGLRGVFVFDPQEWRAGLAAIMRPLMWSGAPSPLARPRTALIASGAPWHYSARVGASLSTPLLRGLKLDAGLPLAELVTRLNDWQPVSMAVYPSILRQLADEQLAGRLRIPLRHVGTSAELLPDATRERVREAWGIPVFDTYGATEYAPIATECREGSLHLMEDRAIFEIVDEQGRAVPPGESGARLLVTVLDRRTQPLIRYEISDGLSELPGRCACGRPFRRLARIEGRVEEALHLPAAQGGATVDIHPNLVHQLLERVPATGWQLRQESAEALTVLLTGRPSESDANTLRRGLAAMLTGRGAALPRLNVRWVAELPRGASGKAPLIVALPH